MPVANVIAIPSLAYGATGATLSSQVPSGLPSATLPLVLSITAFSGTAPTIGISLQWSVDGVTFWDKETKDVFDTFPFGTPATPVVGFFAHSFPIRAGFFRLSNVLAGTIPSVTYTVWMASGLP